MSCQAIIDEASCLAHGDCAEIAPDVFRVDEFAVVVGSAPLSELRAAAEACPACAISIIDVESGQPLYP